MSQMRRTSKQFATKKDVKGTTVSLHVTLGLLNANSVITGRNRKGHQALFWIETSERELTDFRRIL